ncbi:MAG: acyl-CoA thioesterase [Gammaproteobacteria bacterium]
MPVTADHQPFPRERQPIVRILAMPADTNPHGHIFGGWIMAQMDIAGGIVAANRANGRVVTVAVTSMAFHKPVFVGDLVSCFADIEKVGNTSITVRVEVFAERRRGEQVQCVKVTGAVIVYVAVTPEGAPRPVPAMETPR